MSLGKETVVFDVVDAHVYPLLTDSTGASPTYGAAIDVPGISQVSFNPSVTSAELKGDARIIAVRGRVEKMEFQATYGKLSLDVLDAILGSSTVTASGTTPNRKQQFNISSPASSPYFRLEFQITDLDPGFGSLNVVLYKCTLTGGTLITSQTDQFGQPSLQCSAFPVDGTIGGVPNLMASMVLSETFAPLTS